VTDKVAPERQWAAPPTLRRQAARAEMNVRNEKSTEQTRAVLNCHDV
jgi:hypothetical protein